MDVNKNAVHDGVQDVLDWLHRVRWLNELITAKQVERDQLMTLATKVTPNMDGMPHGSGTSDKVGNLAVKMADLLKETDDLIDELIDHRQKVIKTLEKLPEIEYLVMHRHYIQGMSWDDVAAASGYSRQQIWRIKVRALENLKTCYMVL